MAAPNSDYELLTEHLGYSPVSLLDDIINTVNVLADRALDAVERMLLTRPPSKLGFTSTPDVTAEDAAKLEIENGTHQLETVLNASIDKNFDIFELYVMQNILTVAPADRPFVQLSHYAGLDLSENATGSDAPSLESVSALRRRLRASQRVHVALEEERARNDALLGKLRRVLGDDTEVKSEEGVNSAGPLAFLRETGGLERVDAERPLTTTTEFTLSQLQALRSLSTSLRTILPDLAETAADDEGSSKSWRRNRVEYVEGASRKHLEKVGGLELGAQGEVRDGEWQGGSGPERADVEGLERVAAALGRGGEDG